jgi:hypothetical protein
MQTVRAVGVHAGSGAYGRAGARGEAAVPVPVPAHALASSRTQTTLAALVAIDPGNAFNRVWLTPGPASSRSGEI